MSTAARLTGPDPENPNKLYEIVGTTGKAVSIHTTYDEADIACVCIYAPPVVGEGQVKRTAQCVAMSLTVEERLNLAVELLKTLPDVRITTTEENPS